VSSPPTFDTFVALKAEGSSRAVHTVPDEELDDVAEAAEEVAVAMDDDDETDVDAADEDEVWTAAAAPADEFAAADDNVDEAKADAPAVRLVADAVDPPATPPLDDAASPPLDAIPEPVEAEELVRAAAEAAVADAVTITHSEDDDANEVLAEGAEAAAAPDDDASELGASWEDDAAQALDPPKEREPDVADPALPVTAADEAVVA
jgi:hypothetical protein